MTQLSDLDDDSLLSILKWLSRRQLLKMLQVNKRMNRLAVEKLKVKIKAIKLTDSNRLFSDCSHLESITKEQQLNVAPMMARFLSSSGYTFQEPLEVISFLSMLTRYSGVKSIDFGTGHFKLTGDLFVEVFLRCPQLECVKLSKSIVEDNDWERVLDMFGERIVHFVKEMFYDDEVCLQSEARLLAMVAEKCTNIQDVEWPVSRLTSDLMAAFRMLPECCRITLRCDILNEDVTEDVFKDVFDELDILTLNWSALGNQINRLSSLKFHRVEGPVCGVYFTNLKKLEFNPIEGYGEKSVGCLIASRFPQLEELIFNADKVVGEDEFDALFRRMTQLKKLTIFCIMMRKTIVPPFPGPSICRLANIETIYVEFSYVPDIWQPKKYLHQLEQCVQEISSFKKLTVAMTNTHSLLYASPFHYRD